MAEFDNFKRNKKTYRKLTAFNETAWEKFRKASLSRYIYLSNKSVVCCDDYDDESKIRNKFLKKRSFQKWLEDVKQEDRHPDDTCAQIFQKVKKRLFRNKKVMEGRRNADPREFRVHRNVYMVRNYFSFGFQTVPEGCYHLIVTANKHLDLYVAKRHLFFDNGYFPSDFDQEFDEVVVIPKFLKVMEPGKQYLLIAQPKTVFYYEVCSSWDQYQKVVWKRKCTLYGEQCKRKLKNVHKNDF